MPAKAGIQVRSRLNHGKAWIPASAGMTAGNALLVEGCFVYQTTSPVKALSTNSSLISSLRSVIPTISA
jgi:hypothetical protein